MSTHHRKDAMTVRWLLTKGAERDPVDAQWVHREKEVDRVNAERERQWRTKLNLWEQPS